jgi:hypothetical protein
VEKKAEYQISAFVNEGLLEIVLTGEVAESAVKNLANEMITIIKGNGIENVLMDVRAFKGRFGVTKAFNSVRTYPPYRLRVNSAIVDLPENADYQSFQEKTSINAGLSYKWFTDIDAARTWLKNKTRQDKAVGQVFD